MAHRLGEIELTFRQLGHAGQALTQRVEARGFGLQLGQTRSHGVQFALGSVAAERGSVLAATHIDHAHHARAAAHARDQQAGRGDPRLAANEASRLVDAAARML